MTPWRLLVPGAGLGAHATGIRMQCGTPVSHSFERSRWVVTAAQGSAGHGLRSAVAPRMGAAPPRRAAAGHSKRIGKTASHGARLQVALPALQRFAATRGVRLPAEADTDFLRAWRESWTRAPTTDQTKLRRPTSSFRFAAEQGWLNESPTASLRLPKVDPPPTMSLSGRRFAPCARPPATTPGNRHCCS